MQRLNARMRKELMRDEANERQLKYDALTTEQKLKALAGRPGESAREKARLEPLVVKKPRRRRARRETAKVMAHES